MASLALQKLVSKDLVCLPIYRKLYPRQTLIGSAPTLSSTRSRTSVWAAQNTSIPDPRTHPPLSPNRTQRVKPSQIRFALRRALEARATWVGRPEIPSGQVGLGLACPSWVLDPVLAYTMRCIQNRAQSVKAKLHTWCNPMETSLNLNPSPTRFHIDYRHP